MLLKLSVFIVFHSVQDDKSSPFMGIPGHERFGQIVQASAVDDHSWFSYGVDQGSSCSIPQDVDLPPLGAIQESLPHIPMDDQLS